MKLVALKPVTSAHNLKSIQARIAQLVAYQPGTSEVLGSNPGKGENFSMKITH